MENQEKAEWFKNWFNSSYYHQLYHHRNEHEANLFLNNLVAFLKLPPHSTIWDLACGKGRHSIQLNKMGFDVVGTDLSENSISEAQKFSNNTLDFFVHDMRTTNRINYFNAVFNLFTSIGYFENRNDNKKVFLSVIKALKPNGVFIIDFFNATRVKNCLVEKAEVMAGDINFNISKKISNHQIVKHIEFSDKGKDYYFEEKVSLFGLHDFEDFAEQVGFKLIQVFGDYNLSEFNKEHSERLILIFKK